MKVCTKCNKEKEPKDFFKDKTHIDGLSSQCRQCKKEYSAINKEKIKAKSQR